MKCPICSTGVPLHTDRCPGCGYRVPVSVTPQNEAPTQYRRPRRGCLSALLRRMVLMSVVVSLASSLFRVIQTLDTVEEQVIQVPPSESIAETLLEETSPALSAVEGCFSIRDGAVTFLPEQWDGSTILTIPDTVDGHAVTKLDSGCFRDCTELTTIILPEALTAIGDDAFSGCSRLRGLYLPQGMETIGENAFAGCIVLEAICIPSTVSSIAAGVFDDCASLLYINYEGDFWDWAALYDDFITPFTVVICSDGTYYHGVKE